MFSDVDECLYFLGLKEADHLPAKNDENNEMLDLYFFIDPSKLTSLLNKYI